MILIWSAPALRDIDRIAAKYQAISPLLADEILARIDGAPEALLDFPKMAPRFGRHLRRRKWPIQGTPYFLVFEPKRGRVEIKRVFHERQNWLRAV